MCTSSKHKQFHVTFTPSLNSVHIAYEISPPLYVDKIATLEGTSTYLTKQL